MWAGRKAIYGSSPSLAWPRAGVFGRSGAWAMGEKITCNLDLFLVQRIFYCDRVVVFCLLYSVKVVSMSLPFGWLVVLGLTPF